MEVIENINKRLEGKVALITGATKGIGEAAARLFAKEGASVVICGRNSADGEKIASEINAENLGRAQFFYLDVSDYGNWQKAIEFTESTYGKLNILINNAGISYRETIEETTQDSWKKTLDTNQTGVFYGIKLAINSMKKTKEPCSIVSTASVDGKVGDADFFSYCATKAAVEAMTKCAALFCGKERLNIRVNAVAPGYILTDMAEEDARQNGQTIDEYCSESIKLHPIGRLGRPLEIAKAYLYLASEESSFVTGTTLMVDGGYTAQ